MSGSGEAGRDAGTGGGDEDRFGRFAALGAAIGVGGPGIVEGQSLSGSGRRLFWWPRARAEGSEGRKMLVLGLSAFV